MNLRILDFDGSLIRQTKLLEQFPLRVFPLQDWGPVIRMACSLRRFEQFDRALAVILGSAADDSPWLTLYGSGDFHHVTLALLKRQTRPFNLLVLDNHHDWMRGLPFMHCGTWLLHAARLSMVNQIYHVGGNVDFDNYYQWLTPWNLLRHGKIVVFPGLRRFQKGAWASIPTHPLRKLDQCSLSADSLDEMIRPFRFQLSRLPLYVTLDKDVMPVTDAIVNWDSGHVTLDEVTRVMRCFMRAARVKLAGMDIVGDWSPVKVKGLIRWFFHVSEHPELSVDASEASERNADTNVALLESICHAKHGNCLQAG